MSEQIRTERMSTNNETIRMDNMNGATIKMSESPSTVVMSGDGQQTTTGYLSIGEYLNETYLLKQNLTYNTGEATIFICEHEGKEYVAKVYNENFKPKEEVIKRIRSIQSPYVIPIIDEGTDLRTNRFFEIVPYYRNGDLMKRGTFTEEEIIEWIVPSVNEGLHAIHQVGVVHRDIKPRNIFFNDDYSSVIIGDFGISSALNEKQSVNPTKGGRTIGYAAPEVYSNFSSKESDFYSLGITLLELANGDFPYIGMSDEQIMKVTLMDELPIPSSINQRLALLIKGLTRKDRNKRWSYEDVKRWTEGKHVAVADETYQRNIRPYQFNGKEIYTLDELAVAFGFDWEAAKKHLYRGLVRDFVRQFGEDFALKVMECEEIRNHDYGLYQFILQLHSKAMICWKGHMFNDLAEIGKTIGANLPIVQNDICELLTENENLLPSYLQKMGAYENNSAFCHEVDRLIKVAQSDKAYAYFQLYYLLSENKTFHFEEKEFETIDSIIEYFSEQRQSMDILAKKLVNNPYFFAWLSHLGYGEHIQQWRLSLNTKGEKNERT